MSTPAAESVSCDAVESSPPNRVEHDAHGDATSGGGRQFARELVADDAVLINEALEADTTLALADGVEHRREDLVTVAQDRISVSGFDRSTDERRQVLGKPRIACGHRAFDLQRLLILRDEQQ